MDILSDPHLFLHLGALVSVAALALRDQLRLRIVLSASILINAFYHLVQHPGPAWQDLFWNGVTLAINVFVTVEIILDRTHLGLSEEDERLFAMFAILSPGEYRRLVKLGRWHTAEAPVELTCEGTVPDRLFYVVEGPLHMQKNGRSQVLRTPTFIGEIAFMRGSTASATVTVWPGARYLAWPASCTPTWRAGSLSGSRCSACSVPISPRRSPDPDPLRARPGQAGPSRDGYPIRTGSLPSSHAPSPGHPVAQ